MNNDNGKCKKNNEKNEYWRSSSGEDDNDDRNKAVNLIICVKETDILKGI
jgi:hypothetical protein